MYYVLVVPSKPVRYEVVSTIEGVHYAEISTDRGFTVILKKNAVPKESTSPSCLLRHVHVDAFIYKSFPIFVHT